MFSIQQLIKALKKLQGNSSAPTGDLVKKSLKHVAVTQPNSTAASTIQTTSTTTTAITTITDTATIGEIPCSSIVSTFKSVVSPTTTTSSSKTVTTPINQIEKLPRQPNKQMQENQYHPTITTKNSLLKLPIISSQKQQPSCSLKNNKILPITAADTKTTATSTSTSTATATATATAIATEVNFEGIEISKFSLARDTIALTSSLSSKAQNYNTNNLNRTRINQNSNTNKQQIHKINYCKTQATQHNNLLLKYQQQQQQQQQQNQIINFEQQLPQHLITTMSSSTLAAETLTLKQQDDVQKTIKNGSDCHSENGAKKCSSSSSTGKKPCFNTGLSEILQFMELIGNLKHTKRTGWVLRDVNDCESISGHMYRMSMMTFLLDGSEGLNQIRCMELALVHDLAESLVGDITPFCGVTKDEKRTMEFKAMEEICKLIEPRGKRIMELFTEYEHGQSAESKFVKDLDRLDMVMQAFEYEKRDNCLLKHQEFFDSTEGKFNHPFVKKLVNEIYEQRKTLARAKGATPPPTIHVPNMNGDGDGDENDDHDNGMEPQSTKTNGHCIDEQHEIKKSSKSSSS